MANLGILYYDGGHGVSQGFKAASSWFRKSWEKEEYGPCAYNLGSCYYNGEGVTKDIEAARSWFKKGADIGDEDAKYCIERFFSKVMGGARIQPWAGVNRVRSCQRQ